MSKKLSRGGEDKKIEGWKQAVQVTLVSSDGKQIDVDKDVAAMSSMIGGMIENGCDKATIPVPNIDRKTLNLVFKFCKKHNDAAATPKRSVSNLEDFDSKFFDVDQSVLYDLLTAAHFLDIRGLLDAVVTSLVDLVKGKTPIEIRRILGIQNDFTPEEEKELRRSYPWAYEFLDSNRDRDSAMATPKKGPNFEVRMITTDHTTAVSTSSQRKRKRTAAAAAKTMTKITKRRIRPWSDLPSDLIGELIAGFPFPADQIRFGAVCRNYYSSVIPANNNKTEGDEKRRPWVVKYILSKLVLVCKVFNPICQNRPYSVFEITPKYEEFTKTGLIFAKVSKHGWLLFSWSKDPIISNITAFLLFSPFTKQLIELPDLYFRSLLPPGYRAVRAAFSSDPSSLDCVYFVLGQHTIVDNNVCVGKFSISTLCRRHNDNNWTTQVFDQEEPNVGYSSIAYHDGLFYCVSSNGRLASYDVSRRDWKIVVPSRPRRRIPPHTYWSINLVVCKGELLMVALMTLFREEDKDRCWVYGLSSSKKTWVQKTSLGDRALFLGCHFRGCTPFEWPATGEMSDRIYYYRDVTKARLGGRPCQYYSLKDGKCYRDEYHYWDGGVGLVHPVVWAEPPQFKVSELC